MIAPIQKADEKNAYLQEKILGWRVWQIFAVIAAVGILLTALGGFILWSEYTFQTEKVSGLAIVLDKTTKLFNKDREIVHSPPILVQQAIELFRAIGLLGQAGLLCPERPGLFRVASGDPLQHFLDR